MSSSVDGALVLVHNADCSDIARNMHRRLGEGDIIRIEPAEPGNVLTPGNGYEKSSGDWAYHDVLVNNGTAYDPMMEETKGAGAWVDYEEWAKRWDPRFHKGPWGGR